MSMPQLQPLPTNFFNSQILFDAYQCCLCAEKTVPMHARVLGYMLIHIPADKGCCLLTIEINGCKCFDDFRALAELYIQHFICLCEPLTAIIYLNLIHPVVKQQKDRTPIPSDHPSRPSFDTLRMDLMYLLTEPPRNYPDAKQGVSSP